MIIKICWRLDTPEGSYDLGPNEMTTIGLNNILDVVAGLGGTALNAASTYIGVGDSNTAFAAAQTDLQATTNKLRRPMSGGFPSRASQTLTYRSTFITGQAEFAWNEWGLFWGSAGANMVSRRVQAIGTKPPSVTWTLTATLTLG